MDINKEKEAIIADLQRVTDGNLLIAIKAILDYGLHVEEYTLEDYNKELDDAETRMNAGDFVAGEDAENQIKKWMTKDG